MPVVEVIPIFMSIRIMYLLFQLGTMLKSNVHDSTIIFAIVLTRRRLFTETSLKSCKIKICALKIEIFWYPVYIYIYIYIVVVVWKKDSHFFNLIFNFI